MAKVAAYIDGFNLYYGVKSKFARRYLWLDVVELIRRLRPDDEIVAVRFAPAIRAVKQVHPEQRVILAMPPGNPKPHKRFVDLGYFSINETALRRSQLPEVIHDPRTGSERRRPPKWS